MNHTHQAITPLTFLASLCSSIGAELSAPNRMAEVPRNGEIRLQDYGYRNWGPELVRYRVDPKQFPQRNSVLLGPDGKAVPFQINEGMLSFVAELAKGQTVEYTLQAWNKDRSRENSNLSLKKAGKLLEIAKLPQCRLHRLDWRRGDFQSGAERGGDDEAGGALQNVVIAK